MLLEKKNHVSVVSRASMALDVKQALLSFTCQCENETSFFIAFFFICKCGFKAYLSALQDCCQNLFLLYIPAAFISFFFFQRHFVHKLLPVLYKLTPPLFFARLALSSWRATASVPYSFH